MPDNLYKTKQRSLIMKCLKQNSENAYTVDEIELILKNTGSAIGKTTIYRYVKSLEQSGFVRRFVPEDKKSATYQFVEHSENCKTHIHLKCINCGKLIHLECDIVNDMCSHIMLNHGFSVDKSKTTVLGLCEQCLESEEKDETHRV